MTLPEALALQPAWLGIWLNVMMVGTFFLPLLLLIWRPTRLLAVACIVAGVLSAIAVGSMYDQMGYVKLLGLPHIILLTPLAIYLFATFRKPELTKAPKIIIGLILATVLISLAFDYTDVIRYALGERTPLALPPSG